MQTREGQITLSELEREREVERRGGAIGEELKGVSGGWAESNALHICMNSQRTYKNAV